MEAELAQVLGMPLSLEKVPSKLYLEISQQVAECTAELYGYVSVMKIMRSKQDGHTSSQKEV